MGRLLAFGRYILTQYRPVKKDGDLIADQIKRRGMSQTPGCSWTMRGLMPTTRPRSGTHGASQDITGCPTRPAPRPWRRMRWTLTGARGMGGPHLPQDGPSHYRRSGMRDGCLLGCEGETAMAVSAGMAIFGMLRGFFDVLNCTQYHILSPS